MTAALAVDERALRERMIDRLKERGHFSSSSVEAAFRAVPRQLFLPTVVLEKVYSGEAIPTRRDAEDRPISSSSEVAVMIAMAEQLRIEPGQRVLEIGAGTGYNAAILAELVGERGEVATIDIDPEIAAEATGNLRRAGYEQVRVETGDGWSGVADRAPFDRIEATASVADLSPSWVAQLAGGGMLVVPLRLRAMLQQIVAFRKEGQALRSESVLPGGFMPLRGPQVAQEEFVDVGGWYAELHGASAGGIDVLRQLMKEQPRIELATKATWQTMNLLAATEPDLIGLRPQAPESWSVGLLDQSGPSAALLQVTGTPLASPIGLLFAYGTEDAVARLRQRVADLAGKGVRDLRIRAAPSASAGGLVAGVVLRRPNYRFALSLGA